MDEHEVVIAGAGPAGMMLAAELALGGVEAVVVDRRAGPELAGSRAGGIHARTIEVFDQRGIADRFLAAGQTAQIVSFGPAVLDMSDFPTRHPYSLGIFQNKIEAILAEWIAELGVRVRYGCEVVGVAPGEVALAGGETLRAAWVVGCDGGRSVVRKAAGIGFPGHDATRSNLIAEVQTADEPALGLRHDAAGVHGMSPMEGGGVRIVTTEATVGPAAEPTLDELRAQLVGVYGTDFGVHSPTWISRFTDATRQAETYRAGRVLLAGDAAHIHYPAGGQGLSLGVQDAVNLGWKLAQVVRGEADEALLDTYTAERHPVAARALRYTMAQGLLQRRDERTAALAELVAEIAPMDEPRRHLAGLVSGLDIHYDLGDGHPLLGRRMPDLDLGSGRVYERLHDARHVRLDLTTYHGPLELPVLGAVERPAEVLVRPDGYVAEAKNGVAS